MKRAVVVICDGLRADMVTPGLTPNLCALAREGQSFTRNRGVFPSTTRTTSASIATGCLPGRHGLEGNCVAIDLAPTILRHLGLPLGGMDGKPLSPM